LVKKTKTLKCLEYNVIRTLPGTVPGKRLNIINCELSKIIKKYKPDVLAIENVYFFKNLKTVMPVSQAKGVILLTAAKKRVPVYEFTPLQIKLSITGNGRADKKEVQKNIKRLLNLKEIPKPDDAADALATALTYIAKSSIKKPKKKVG
jgi:crossover junction endodeoxyribonuclease RuvC